jgi:tryptophan-rich sensory protein
VAGLAAWILASFAAASSGLLFPPGDWYASLEKPSWNPPPWVFGPVWTALYLMMAVAAWRVWRAGGFTRQGRSLGLYLLQLGLNALWTPLFFGAHQMGAAFFCIVLLWLAIAATMTGFGKVDKLAALLLAPYLAWVTFAAFLNFTLWRLNAG